MQNIETACRKEKDQGKAHRLVDEYILARPGEIDGLPEALLQLCVEDCSRIIEQAAHVDFHNRDQIMSRFPRDAGGVKDMVLELVRVEFMDSYVDARQSILARQRESSEIVPSMRLVIHRRLWSGRTPGGRPSGNIFNQWSDKSVKRLLSLQRAGIIPENHPALVNARLVLLYVRLHQGRYHDVSVIYDDVVKASGNDPAWMFARARYHHWMGSLRAAELFRESFAALDGSPADERTRLLRKQAEPFEIYLQRRDRDMPGSWLAEMIPDGMEQACRAIELGQLRGEEETIDAMIGQIVVEDTVFPREDGLGGGGAWYVIDDHLSSLPSEAVIGLRELQEQKCASNVLSKDLAKNSNDELNSLFRRYPWAETAQRGLIRLGRRQLEAGRGQLARRTFREVMNHTDKADIRALAQSGLWVAISQGNNPAELTASFKGIRDDEIYPWMGEETTVGEIRKRLMQGMTQPAIADAASRTQKLADLRPQVVRVPALPLWPGARIDEVAGLDLLSMQFSGTNMLISSHNAMLWYDINRTSRPLWSRINQTNPSRHVQKYTASEVRPSIIGNRIYTRHSYDVRRSHVACLETATGDIKWGVNSGSDSDWGLPVGEPVVSEELVYSIIREKAEYSNLALCCMDANSGMIVWMKPLRRISSFDSNDRKKKYSVDGGSCLTIHDGAIYSSPTLGVISRSDIRDGRVEWTFEYTETLGQILSGSGIGFAPVVYGNTAVFMPRDSHCIFGLDRRTGRLAWKHPFVLPEWVLGLVGKNLIVQGRSLLVSLDIESGNTNWSMMLEEETLGCPKLNGSSIHLGSRKGIKLIDAETGIVREEMSWPDVGDKVMNFAVHDGALYMITDRPSSAEQSGIAWNPLTTHAIRPGELKFPVKRIWKLSRYRPIMHVPPEDFSPSGRALVRSGNIIECINTDKGGSIEWHRFIDPGIRHVVFSNGQAILFISSSWVSFRIVALDMKTGNCVWESEAPFGKELQYLDNGNVLLRTRGRIGCLDQLKGKLVWSRLIASYGIMSDKFAVGTAGDRINIIHHAGHSINSTTIDLRNGIKTAAYDILKPKVKNNPQMFKLLFDGAFIGAQSAYVGITRRIKDQNMKNVYTHLVYRWDKKNNMELVSEPGILHSFDAPYALVRVDHKDKNKKHVRSEIITLKEDSPSFKRSMEIETRSDKIMLLNKLTFKFASQMKKLQVFDTESGEEVLTHEVEEFSIEAFECEGDRLLIASRNTKTKDSQLLATVYDMRTWKKLGSQELSSIPFSRWNGYRGDSRPYLASERGVRISEGNGVLLICGDDGICAYKGQ